jgi:hypothetical protein
MTCHSNVVLKSFKAGNAGFFCETVQKPVDFCGNVPPMAIVRKREWLLRILCLFMVAF